MPEEQLELISTTDLIDLKLIRKLTRLALKGVTARTENPWMLISCDGNKLQLRTASVVVTAEHSAEPFAVIVDPKEFQGLLKQEDKKVKAVVLNSSGIDGKDYPVVEAEAKFFEFTQPLVPVDSSKLLAGLLFLDNFASAKSAHAGFRFENNQLIYLDTQGEGTRRVVIARDFGLSIDISPAFTIPLSVISAIKEFLKVKEAQVLISSEGLRVSSEQLQADLLFNTLDIDYPDLSSLKIPSKQLFLSKQDTLSALEALAVVFEESFGRFYVSALADRVTLSVGDNEQIISASTTDIDSPVTIPFDLKYLKDFLASITSELFIFSFEDQYSPVGLQPFEALNFYYTFYPLRVVEYA